MADATLDEASVLRLRAAREYICNSVVEDKLLEKTYIGLSSQWERYQSLNAAMKLLAANGVRLTPEEEQRMASLDDRQMIDALVAKMPSQSKEEFQEFFLQLQIIVSTATRVRQGLEACRPDLVQMCLEEAEQTGMLAYILKLAIVSAGWEVINMKRQHKTWVKESEVKLSKLLRGQEDSIKAKKRLAALESKLKNTRKGMKDQAKQVLVSLAAGSDTSTMHTFLLFWKECAAIVKKDREIYEEFQDELEHVEGMLISYEAKQLRSIKDAIHRNHYRTGAQVALDVLHQWQEYVSTAKMWRTHDEKLKSVGEDIRQTKDEKNRRAAKVLMKMVGDDEKCVKLATIQAWQDLVIADKLSKRVEQEAGKTDEHVKSALNKTASNAKYVLASIAGHDDHAVRLMTFMAWVAVWKDVRHVNGMSAQLKQTTQKSAWFGQKNKQSAMAACEKGAVAQDEQLVVRVFGSWSRFTKVEKVVRRHQTTVEGKKAQLAKVQIMFRDFAVKLEAGFRSGAPDSDRNLEDFAKMPMPKRHMSRNNENAVSLPSIHKQPSKDSRGHGRSKRPEAAEGVPRPKEAWQDSN